MTWKNGSTHSTTGERTNGVTFQQATGRKSGNPERGLKENPISISVIDKLKARSLKAIRRSRKKKVSLRRSSKARTAVAMVGSRRRRSSRVVHFNLDDVCDEKEDEFAQLRPFRRSSKFRQPVQRMSRVKGSPPPSQLARIHQFNITQPNFGQTSDGESADEDPLPPILLQSEVELSQEKSLRHGDGEIESEQRENDRESDQDNSGDGPGSEGETYTVLPAVTISATEVAEAEEEIERHACATNPLAGGESELEGSIRMSTKRVTIRRRSYRASVRRASTRRRPSVRRASIRRPSVRRASIRRTSVWNNASRRQSVATRTFVQRRSAAIPGCVYRRRSIAARSPYDTNALRGRKKRRRLPRPYRRPRKIVVIGDMCSGKTSLISAYCRDKFSEMYVPTILTSCMTDADIMGAKIELVVVEVAGRIDYASIRRCAYHKMDVVILCYSADSPDSLNAIKNKWLPELKKFAPKVPYILVGTKTDVREERVCEVELVKNSLKNSTDGNSNSTTTDPHPQTEDTLTESVVTTRQGQEAARQIGAQDFIECSAMYRDGTRDVFETAAKIALRRSPRRKKKHYRRTETCTIL